MVSDTFGTRIFDITLFVIAKVKIIFLENNLFRKGAIFLLFLAIPSAFLSRPTGGTKVLGHSVVGALRKWTSIRKRQWCYQRSLSKRSNHRRHAQVQDCEPIEGSPSGTHKGRIRAYQGPQRSLSWQRPAAVAEALSRGQPPLTVTGGVETRLNKQHTVNKRAATYGPQSAGAEVPQSEAEGDREAVRTRRD